jgi:glucose-1-phosphate thymidylyltransferase
MTDSEYVALLPAAGIGSRLPNRQGSKELLRFGGGTEDGDPVISHVLGCMDLAGVNNVIVVLRDEKKDIFEYLTSSEWSHFKFAFEFTPGTSGVPETVALGLGGTQARSVIFGFPDILFEPRDAFVRLIERLENSGADVVLGLFPTANPAKMDMVATDESGRVTEIQIKPDATTLDLTWILAAWRPSFSAYIAANHEGSHLGDIFQLAMADGMQIESEPFVEGRSLDIGTPDDLDRARTWLSPNA